MKEISNFSMRKDLVTYKSKLNRHSTGNGESLTHDDQNNQMLSL